MNQTTETLPEPGTYRLKANAFVPERTYRLTGNALTWQESDKPLDGVFYDEISEVRLAFAPTRFDTNRYRAQVIFREGGMAEMFNTTYRGMMDFPEQNVAYVAFILALHECLATHGRDVAYRYGNTTGAYIGNWLLTIFIGVMLVVIAMMLVAWGVFWLAILKLVVIVAMLPTLLRYMRSAKPGAYDPRAIPDTVLPKL